MRKTLQLTFNITDEHYKMIAYNGMTTGRTRSKILQIMLNEGVKLTFVENMYLQNPEENEMGIDACKKLQLLNIIPEITTDHKLVYGVQELQQVEEMTDIINAKLAKGKTRICASFEPGLLKYLTLFKNYYQCTAEHLIAKLIMNGLALTFFSDNPDHYSEQDLKQFAEIRQYIVHFDPHNHNASLAKSIPNTHTNFNKFNKSPADCPRQQGMLKPTIQTITKGGKVL